MTTTEADRIVLDQLCAQAAGIRMRAKDALVGTRAGLIEQELTLRLAECVKLDERRQQAELSLSDPEEEPLPLAASQQPGGNR